MYSFSPDFETRWAWLNDQSTTGTHLRDKLGSKLYTSYDFHHTCSDEAKDGTYNLVEEVIRLQRVLRICVSMCAGNLPAIVAVYTMAPGTVDIAFIALQPCLIGLVGTRPPGLSGCHLLVLTWPGHAFDEIPCPHPCLVRQLGFRGVKLRKSDQSNSESHIVNQNRIVFPQGGGDRCFHNRDQVPKCFVRSDAAVREERESR